MQLRGDELAGFIKEQQARMVRSLQYTGKKPKLAVVVNNKEVVSSKYISFKGKYGEDIGVSVERHDVDSENLTSVVARLNEDEAVHGVIVQLPLADDADTEVVLNSVAPGKDVDGLGEGAEFTPATPTAILWLLSGHGIELSGKNVGVIGRGRLVGAPLLKMLEESGHNPKWCDKEEGSIEQVMAESDIVISATGSPGLITEDMVLPGQVIIDAGTTSSGGSLIGDVESSLYDRDDIKVSPVPGGVGPLTVCALFGNLIEAFKRQVD